MEKPAEEAIQKAQELARATDDEMARAVTSLRKSKRLFTTVHELNKMLRIPELHGLALKALKRLGLDKAG